MSTTATRPRAGGTGGEGTGTGAVSGDTGKDWTTRRLGSVTDWWGERLSVEWDPKSGPFVRVEGAIAEDCEGDEPDEDGYCRGPQALVCHLSLEQAEELGRWLIAGAAASRAFFEAPAETPHDTPQEAVRAAVGVSGG